MLTQTLRELERHGIVHRRDYGEVPPRVEYSLTRLGRSLSDLIRQIEGWVTANYARMTIGGAHLRRRFPRQLAVERGAGFRAHLFGGDPRRQLDAV